ncbi:MAG: glycosyltransferase [Elusimicrobiota bacterium]|nr:MAG: glycosyltransferase [Elusimicrobiota bacterium]
MPHLTVVFTPRERFSLADKSLRTLFANCALPFQLVVVEGDAPEPYKSRMHEALKGRPDVTVIRTEGYVLPGRARNLGLEKATGDLILFIENDNMIRPGCVERLVETAREYPGGLIQPWLWEGRTRHYDWSASEIVELPDGSIDILPERTPPIPLDETPRRVTFMEHHCYLITRPALAKLGREDEELNTREAVDMSVAAWRKGVPVILEPRAQVDFKAPPPVEREETDFFHFRWEVGRADASNRAVAARWKVKNMPDTYSFVREQMLRKNQLTWSLIRARDLVRKIWHRAIGR